MHSHARGRGLGFQREGTELLTQPWCFLGSSPTQAEEWCLVILLMLGTVLVMLSFGWGWGFPSSFHIPLEASSVFLYCLKQCFDHKEQPGELCVMDYLSALCKVPRQLKRVAQMYRKATGPDSSSPSPSHWPSRHGGSAVIISYWLVKHHTAT